MTDYQARPTIMRTHDKFVVEQVGDWAQVNGQGSMRPVLVTEIQSNPKHILHAGAAKLRAAGHVAVVVAVIDGKTAVIGLTADQWAAGADERARYAAWSAEQAAVRRETQRLERAFDGQNEGGDGFNPYRHGSEPTYRGRR